MMKYYEQKVVWITGASAGIGEALAYALSKQHAKLILSARRPDLLHKVKQACTHPDLVVCITLDLEDATMLDPVVEKAIAAYGHIDMLINNAGISQRCNAIDTDDADHRRIFELNYFGTVALTNRVIKHFRAGNRGDIVAISSLATILTPPNRTAYVASKIAMEGYFSSLRYELTATAINIMIVRPGAVRTNIGLNAIMGNGQNEKDCLIEYGMSPDRFVNRVLSAIPKKKRTLVVANKMEWLSFLIRRLYPTFMFSK